MKYPYQNHKKVEFQTTIHKLIYLKPRNQHSYYILFSIIFLEPDIQKCHKEYKSFPMDCLIIYIIQNQLILYDHSLKLICFLVLDLYILCYGNACLRLLLSFLRCKTSQNFRKGISFFEED